jgi:MFS transporter, FHS family, L-fucose permease
LSQSAPLTEQEYVLPFVLLTSLFFVWLIGVNLNDVLIPHFKKAFDLTDFQSSFIQVAFFGGYFLAAFPAGRLMEKIGYKKGILAGLLICAAGTLLFLPAASSRLYGFFLLALFVISSGQSFLEVGANPYVTVLGPPESSERRLNLAQSFNAVGAALVPTLGAAFILSGIEYTPAQRAAMNPQRIQAYIASEANMVNVPYLVISGIFLLVAALIYFAHLPEVQPQEKLDLKDDPKLIAEYRRYHEKIWPEITKSIKHAGIVDLEIYLLDTRMFMVMEVDEQFSFEKKARADRENPKVREWEELMWKFQ